MMIFNQFEEMGNPLWHYNVTGYALADLFEAVKKPGQRLAGACFTSGSAGTMSAGDLLKERYPGMKLGVGEALQCPTILNNGFGGHRIEGIGDKHIPWIHNVKNTDMAIAIDDEDSQRLLRLFNTAEGQEVPQGRAQALRRAHRKLTWLGISGIANVLCCIKMAKYYELTEDDVVCTVLTDSAVMYGSRIEELNEKHGAYSEEEARLDHNLHMLGLKTDSMMELTYEDRKRIHNLKYYTWVEQQARDVKDLNALWYDTKGHVGRRPRAGEGARRAHQRVQRGHRPSQSALRARKGEQEPLAPNPVRMIKGVSRRDAPFLYRGGRALRAGESAAGLHECGPHFLSRERKRASPAQKKGV